MNSYEIKYYNYDVEKYPFVSMIKNLYSIEDLTAVHTLLDKDNVEKYNLQLFKNENDTFTPLHEIFYRKINNKWDEFYNVYKNFINYEIMNIFGVNKLIYQTTPSFRIQLPNNIAVGGNKTDDPEKYGWHRDTDENYNHPSFEHNFIIPLTEASETSTIHIETSPYSNKFTAAKMKVGQFFKFNGGECLHGNKPNKTGKSRISLDFRVVLESDYNQEYLKESKLSGKKFVVGSYYAYAEKGK